MKNNIVATTETRSQSKSNVPVNKGHFDLDTPERISAFHEKLGSGWSEYQDYRNAWHYYPTNMIVRDYPILVDLELASNCNLKCPMCYTTTDHFMLTVKRKLMKWELAKKVIDEIAGHVYALRLSWRGESTLNNKMIDVVRYAKEKGIREISFLTNGWKLNLDYFIELQLAGIDWITVSFDGVEEEYNKIRKPLVYEETLNKLLKIKEYKILNNLDKPVIKVQGIWPSIRNNPEKFYNVLSNVSDLVAFNPLIDYLGKDERIVYEENFSCPQIYQRLFVSSTGESMMCNSDEYGDEIVGDANIQSIHDIWHGENLNRIRSLHKENNGFMKVPICTKCYYPRKTEANETAQVNGRTIKIRNYINRKQSAGE
ncbi:MAG: radical SAM protein [Opitutae bacterium]|jgi:sulfatase maturation enzyme AslB (radical SAM superfamily)|nr:radical SAM protein [Opitutae bacterium]